MKKTLLILCALLLTAIGASAQIEDVTAKYIKNASFESSDTLELTADSGRGYSITELPDWVLNGPNGNNAHKDIMTAASTETDANYGIPGEPSDGTQMLYLRDAWGDNTGSVTQTVKLPAGTYKLTVDSKCAAGDPTYHSASLIANGETTALTIHAKGTPTADTAKEPFVDEWDTAVLEFSLDEETEVELGVQLTFGNQQYGLAVILDNFKLYSMEVEYDNNVTWKLANPSFEVDNVAYLTEDATRCHTDDNDVDGSYTGGAYTIANGLTGWTLEAPTSTTADRAISDLLTAACQRTDNGYGAPGTPTDGSQLLYLRCAWESKTGSVTQVVSLPEGEYKLTVDSKCVTTGEGHSAILVVDETSISLPVHSSYTELDWDTTSLIFEVGEGGADVTIGVKATFSTSNLGLSVLLDNFKLYTATAEEDFTETIEWTMTEAGWGTMILPFAADVPDGLTLYDGDALTIDGSTITVGTEAESIAANTAYLVKSNEDVTEDGVTYTFTGTPTNEGEIYTTGCLTGTLVDLAVAKGAAFATDGTQYLLQNHDGEGEGEEGIAFYPIIAESSSDATLDAYHCYLTIAAEESEDGEPAKLSIVLPGSGEATGIVAVEGAEAEANGAIYDLSGRRVAKAVKGVYIQNGKKVLVK